jgi:hypothetical protein
MKHVLASIGMGLVFTIAALIFGLVWPPIAALVAMGFIPVWILCSLFIYWLLVTGAV